MASIILSIHKRYCNLLFEGKKRFEFRKSLPTRPITSIIVYEAKGSGKIIGELTVKETLVGTPEEIWLQTKDLAGIDKESFFSYYDQKQIAVVYIIDEYIRFRKYKSLSDFGVSRPPQNYIWVKD